MVKAWSSGGCSVNSATSLRLRVTIVMSGAVVLTVLQDCGSLYIYVRGWGL